MKKRTGTIRPYGPGGDRHLARIMIHGVELSGVFDHREDAERFLQHAIRRADAEAAIDPTLASIADAFFLARESGGYVSHAKKERSTWKNHIASDAIASKPLRAIELPHLVKWAERLAAKPSSRTPESTVSRQTQKHAVTLMRAAMLYALRQGLIRENVAEALVPVKVRADAGVPWSWLTPGEIAGVLALDHDDERLTLERRSIYATAIYAGLRVSELLHLRWEHVHLAGRRPRIEVRAPIKTSAALRDVPLLPPIIEHLGAWHRYVGEPATGLVWPAEHGGRHHDGFDAAWSDHAYRVATRRDGQEVTERRVRPGALARAGIARKVRFHDLRHTFCSHLAQGTWGRPFTLHEIKDLAGHSDIKVTQRYAHLSPLGIHGAIAGMREAWGRPSDDSGPQSGTNVTTDASSNNNLSTTKDENVAGDKGFEPLTFGSGGGDDDE